MVGNIFFHFTLSCDENAAMGHQSLPAACEFLQKVAVFLAIGLDLGLCTLEVLTVAAKRRGRFFGSFAGLGVIVDVLQELHPDLFEAFLVAAGCNEDCPLKGLAGPVGPIKIVALQP